MLSFLNIWSIFYRMPETLTPLRSKIQTGRAMHSLVRRFHGDLENILISQGKQTLPLSSLDLEEFHKFVREIPYRRDDAPVEVVARPSRIVTMSSTDCKKKGILMGSYFKHHNIPFRFLALSTRPDRQAHHVAPQFRYEGDWVNADATYRYQRIGMPKRVTSAEVLKP